MTSHLAFTFDTNVFNRLLDGVVPIDARNGRVNAHATHIQRDANSTMPLTWSGKLLNHLHHALRATLWAISTLDSTPSLCATMR